jgi:ribonuclease HII
VAQSGFDFFEHAVIIAGVDEVGRGPLIGDVVTAAVILDPEKPIEGLDDSKKISESRRELLAEQIKENALAYSIARASVEEIDKINILQATMLAMSRAVNALSVKPELCQIDGNRVPKGLPCPAEAIIKGDGKIPAISAASILAKVQRDAEMKELGKRHPEYGFDRNKGYGTKEHLKALQKFGVLKEHRKTFGPVKNLIELNGKPLT